VFSHDDKWSIAIVDTTGENEIWRFAADGAGHGERLTTNGDSHRWQLYPSPDGKWLAHTDKRGRTWLLDLATRHSNVVDDAGQDRPRPLEDQVVWSPDSRNLAIVRAGSSEAARPDRHVQPGDEAISFVTTDRYEASSPAFSPDGKWLYFLSSATSTSAMARSGATATWVRCSTSASASSRWRCSRATASRSSPTTS
jgi:tricorn protease